MQKDCQFAGKEQKLIIEQLEEMLEKQWVLAENQQPRQHKIQRLAFSV